MITRSKLAMTRPAAVSRISESATSLMTIALRERLERREAVLARVLLVIALSARVRIAFSTGAMPERIAVSNVMRKGEEEDAAIHGNLA